MDLGIAGRTAAVAGATAGLGFASASALATEGVRVAICGRERGRVDDAVARIGHDAVGIVADVGTPDGAKGFVDDATAALGHLDILVTNAGGPPPGGFASTDLDAYEPALALNLLSVVAMCKAAVPSMQERRWGRVVAITSIAVRQPIETLDPVEHRVDRRDRFLKSVAREVARRRCHRELRAAGTARDRPLDVPVRR